VLEAQQALVLAGEDEIGLGEARHQRIGRVAVADSLEQPGRYDLADDRRGAYQLCLVRAQPRKARLNQPVDPAASLGRAQVQLP
jgi:hypothetical protein